MSRPMLPGQNSKYWGYDLNNYLLSLDEKINGLESFHQNQQTIVQNVGPGFQTGTWDLITTKTENGVTTNLSIGEYTLGGVCSYEVYAGGTARRYTHNFDNDPYKVFEKVSVISYNSEGKLSYPSDESTTLPTTYPFYAVYLFFERTADGNSDTVKTILCKDYIFRGDCVMIGSYEMQGSIFTPRVQTSSKTLYQSGQDTIKSNASIVINSTELTSFPTNTSTYTLKEGGTNKVFSDIYYFYTNGINPSAILEVVQKNTLNHGNGFDVGKFSGLNEKGITYRYNENANIEEGDSLTGPFSPKGVSKGNMLCYYLAPSGNLYVQEHAAPTNLPTAKDYMLEASDPLRDKEGFITGGLVFIGAVYMRSDGVYQWISAKQNGISPVIIDVDNNNPHKILIENNEYYVGSNVYKIKLSKISDDHVAVHLTDYVKNPSNFIDAKIDFITPEFRIFNGNSIEGEVILNCFKDANNNQLGQLILAGDETSGIILQGGDAYSKITLRHLDEDKIIINSKSDGGTIILSGSPDNYGCVLSGDGETFTIKCGQNQGGKFEVFEDSTEDFQVSVEGKFKVKGNTTLTDGQVDIGTSINSNKFNVYNNSTFYGPVTIGTHSSSTFTVKRATILTEGFKTDSLETYYFNSNGNIKCNDITFTSDIRLKTNLKPINPKICHDAVQKLSARTYTYTKNNYDTLGLIAQEIEEQLPEYAHLLVHENEDGEKMVSEHKLLFILWEALKQEIKERKGGK